MCDCIYYRYSYHHKLIPLLLTGLTDEVDEIKETAHKLWIQVCNLK